MSPIIGILLMKFGKSKGMDRHSLAKYLRCTHAQLVEFSQRSLPAPDSPEWIPQVTKICADHHVDIIVFMNIVNELLTGYSLSQAYGAVKRFWRCEGCSTLLVAEQPFDLTVEAGARTCPVCRIPRTFQELALPEFVKEANLTVVPNQV